MGLCPHLKQGLDDVESRLGIGGVEDGFHKEQVHHPTSLNKCAHVLTSKRVLMA
jgi:hypothetical protein